MIRTGGPTTARRCLSLATAAQVLPHHSTHNLAPENSAIDARNPTQFSLNCGLSAVAVGMPSANAALVHRSGNAVWCTYAPVPCLYTWSRDECLLSMQWEDGALRPTSPMPQLRLLPSHPRRILRWYPPSCLLRHLLATPQLCLARLLPSRPRRVLRWYQQSCLPRRLPAAPRLRPPPALPPSPP